MNDKTTILIDIIGRPKSGKSTIVSLVAKTLINLGIHVEINWGLDGEPKSHTDAEKLESRVRSLIDMAKIVMTEKQAPRGMSLEYKAEEDTAEKIAKWVEQKTGVPVEDIDNAWTAKLIRRGDWRRDTSMDD